MALNKMMTDNPFARTVLGALQGKHIYGGTVPAETVANRRAKNKAARRSRRINRTSR